MRADEGFLVAIVAALLLLSAAMVLPYAQFLVAAVLLAFVLHPLHRRLRPRVGAEVSAATLVTLTVVAVLLPFFAVAAFVAGDVARFLRRLSESDVHVGTVESLIARYTGRQVDVAARLQASSERIGETVFGGAIAAFETITHLLIGTGVLLFVLFFVIRDGHRLVAWLRDVVPLPPEVWDDLLAETGDITRAVLAGHVLVAIVQGVLAGIGLAVTGVPNAAFWTVIMVVLALIPVVGAFAVWAPASVYLFLQGDVVAAVGLFVYGAVVVGLTDDYLRPVVVDRYAQVNPSVIIVGVVGGLSAFGFVGLFIGPVIVGVLKAAVEVYDEHYGTAYEVDGG